MKYKANLGLIKKGKLLDPAVIIGKKGITDSVLEEVKLKLNQYELIKVKMLGSFVKGKDKDQLAMEVSTSVGADLIHMTGFSFLLYKTQKPKIRNFI